MRTAPQKGYGATGWLLCVGEWAIAPHFLLAIAVVT